MATLKGVCKVDWKPAPDARTPSRSVPAPAPITAARAASTGTSSPFFAMPLAPRTWNLPVFAPVISSLDDLEKYLELPAISNMDLDLLALWKARDHNLPEGAVRGLCFALLGFWETKHIGTGAAPWGLWRARGSFV